MAITSSPTYRWPAWLELLRWHKPTGRLILLLPAGWSLWLGSNNPSGGLLLLIVIGGMAVSGAGCIANDLWDYRIDARVARTSSRPLARGALSFGFAWTLLILTLLTALLVVLELPAQGRELSLQLAVLALPPILIYPSAKRWFAFPQALLALCWGFAVLIPWAASNGNLAGGWPLWGCWAATLCWTFGFDTVYAMADREDDERIGVRSSALSLGAVAVPVVAGCYLLAWLLLSSAALAAGMGLAYLLPALVVLGAGWREVKLLAAQEQQGKPRIGRHFQRQVLLGALLWLAMVLGRATA